MTSSNNDRSQREQKLDALIAEYYQAVEAGRPIDRNAWILQHPDFAAELREFIADLGRLEQVAPQLSPVTDETRLVENSETAVLQRGATLRYFGDYEIQEELGAGGMGVVYRARHAKLKKIVALKMIRLGPLASVDEVRRFQAEARAAAKLDHPNIVPVHEVGVHHGQHFYAMDFVAGGSLAKLHRDEPVAARRAADLVKQLAEAMHYAHTQGIVHRDLKPANVMLTPSGAPRITDFGLAKRLQPEDDSVVVTKTETGQILGTAGYMSPEQAGGKTRLVGPPADIYALGAILYALLTGRAPFVGESQADTILQVMQKEPVSPRILNPRVARDLETICLKCLEKEPHKRYGTAQLLANDLARFLDNRPVLARPITLLERNWRWCRRNPALAAFAALVLIVGCIAPIVANQMYGLAIDKNLARREVTEKTTKLDESLTKQRSLSSMADNAFAAELKARSERTAALKEKERALSEAEEKSREIARRNYVTLLSQAPELWHGGQIAELRQLLNKASAQSIVPNEFAAAYWTARLQEAAPSTSFKLPEFQQFLLSQDGRRAVLAQTHPEDIDKPKNAYKRKVVELFYLVHDPSNSAAIRFEHQRQLKLPYGSHSPKLAILPNCKTLAVTAGDGPDVHLINFDSGEPSLAFKTNYSMYGRCYFSEAGGHFFKYDDREARWEVWNINERTRTLLPKREEFRQQSNFWISDDGKVIAADSGLVFNVDGGAERFELPENLKEAQFSPGNRFLIGAGALWNLEDGSKVCPFPVHARCTFSRENPQIAFFVSAGVLHRLDLHRGHVTPLRTIGLVANLTLLSGAETQVIGTLDDSIAIWSTSRSAMMETLQLGQIQAVSANRHYVVARARVRNSFEVWDLFARTKLADFGEASDNNALPSQFKLYSFGISDDALVAYTSDRRKVAIFDAKQNKHLTPWEPRVTSPPAAQKVATITPDGKTVLLGEASALHRRDLTTNQDWILTQPPPSRFDFIRRDALSPDSQWLAVGSELFNLRDQTKVELPFLPAGWVALNGESMLAASIGDFVNPKSLQHHRFAVPENEMNRDQRFDGIAISSDGLTVASVLSGSPRGRLRVFSVDKVATPPSLLPVFELETGGANHCAFTPDNHTLLLIGQHQVDYLIASPGPTTTTHSPSLQPDN